MRVIKIEGYKEEQESASQGFTESGIPVERRDSQGQAKEEPCVQLVRRNPPFTMMPTDDAGSRFVRRHWTRPIAHSANVLPRLPGCRAGGTPVQDFSVVIRGGKRRRPRLRMDQKA